MTPNMVNSIPKDTNIGNSNHRLPATPRSIIKDFNTEDTLRVSKGRQSILYSYDDWNTKTPEQPITEGFFGHSMEIINNTAVFRVLLQNPNGINPDPKNQDLQLLFNACYDHCVSLIGLTETNVEWGHYMQKENLRQSLNKW